MNKQILITFHIKTINDNIKDQYMAQFHQLIHLIHKHK